MKKIYICSLFLMILLIACSNNSFPTYESISGISNCEKEALKAKLANANVVLVGNVTFLEKGWFPGSGIAPSFQTTKWRIKKILKGTLYSKEIVIKRSIIGTERDEEQSVKSPNLIRLNRKYYRQDKDFIVFLHSNENGEYTFDKPAYEADDINLTVIAKYLASLDNSVSQ